MADTKAGGVRTILLLFAGSVLAGAIAGYLAGGGSRGQAPGGTGESGGELSGPLADAEEGEDNPYAGFRVGDFDLLDRRGEPIDESVLEGEVTVLTFFFTSCNGPCPAIARVMKGVQDRTAAGDAKRLRLASISVDGGRDTPAVIDSFAESYGVDPDRWAFMTGDPEAVRALVRESIGFELREQADVQVADPTGAMMNNILHPTRLLLVGPDRRLIGVYPFNDPDAVDEMVRDAMRAMG